MPDDFELFVHFTLQLGVILAACRLCGIVLRWLGQPQVVADMTVGLLLGPALLGLLVPDFRKWLFSVNATVSGSQFPHPSMSILYTIGHLGLVLYMFIVGMRLDLTVLSRHVRHSVATSLTGLGVPLLAGCALGLLLARVTRFFGSGVGAWEASLFVGAVLSVTAFPMLARIVHEAGAAHTRVGVLALACAAVDDVGAWILLAFVVVLATGDASAGLVALGGTVAYVAAVMLAGRPLLRRLGTWGTTSRGLRPEALLVAVAVLLFVSWGTDTLGVYSVFGAFVLGTAMPRGRFTEQLAQHVEPLERRRGQQGRRAVMTLLTTVAAAPLHRWFHRATDRDVQPQPLGPELARARGPARAEGPPEKAAEPRTPVTLRSTSHRR